MKRYFPTLVLIELVLLFLVVIAGSVVRVTGAGMGCPDWPKCFGYLIPPTEESQVMWASEKEFEKGQMIVFEETLYKAKGSFVTGESIDLNNWEKYTKHDYAIFNAVHTWTEYINRLFGALSGVPMLLIFFIALISYRRNIKILLLSLFGLFGLGFEAWLGKVVIEGNLIPNHITYHMMMAVFLVIAMVALYHFSKRDNSLKLKKTPGLRIILWSLFLLMFVQVILGTQVREQVDHIIDQQGGAYRSEWFGNLDWRFFVHRSFSWVVVGLTLLLQYNVRKVKERLWGLNLVTSLIVAEVLSGAILIYFDFPFLLQPMHLLMSIIITALIFKMLLNQLSSSSETGGLVG